MQSAQVQNVRRQFTREVSAERSIAASHAGRHALRLWYDEGRVNVSITNPIPDASSKEGGRSATEGNRMALNNIRSRLEVLYGSSAVLSTLEENNRFVTSLSYPYALS